MHEARDRFVREVEQAAASQHAPDADPAAAVQAATP
jgi:hypothetical protein